MRKYLHSETKSSIGPATPLFFTDITGKKGKIVVNSMHGIRISFTLYIWQTK